MYALAGAPILQSSWSGFNGCVFAYGQTNSGKTYTMMGTKRDPGLIPRLCRQLFERLEEQNEEEQKGGKKRTTTVQVTYMEIYNEQVKDLLRPKPKAQQRFASRFDAHSVDEYQSLKVRQHPLHGPFVEGITKVDVKCWLECVQIIRAGNELRAQAQTSMNDTSSRSHAIFQIIVTHTEALGAKVRGKAVTNHRVSKLNLVDLAGSERLVRSGVTGKHVTEATHINQSLSTLRKVIDALLQNAKAKAMTGTTTSKKLVIPYRESLLTWILADNFGGNSKTIMIATVSPAASSWQETESTLRYATVARGVTNRVRVNEDPSTKLIRELQGQLKALQDEMTNVRASGTLSAAPDEARVVGQQERVKELEEQMEMNHKAMEELQSREEVLRREMDAYRAREQQLLKTQEELRKGEKYWKQRAQELTVESEKLREELRAVRSTDDKGDDSIIELVDGPAQGFTSELLGPSLRATKEDKRLFWMDDDEKKNNEEKSGKDTPGDDKPLTRRKSVLRRDTLVAAATAAAAAAAAAEVKSTTQSPIARPKGLPVKEGWDANPVEESTTSTETTTATDKPATQAEEPKPHPKTTLLRKHNKDRHPSVAVSPRSSTPPGTGSSNPASPKTELLPRPITEQDTKRGPPSPKFGRRAHTGDAASHPIASSATPGGETTAGRRSGGSRRAHTHLNTELVGGTNNVAQSTTALPSMSSIAIDKDKARTPPPPLASVGASAAGAQTRSTTSKPPVQRPSGGDALDQFLTQPVVSVPTRRVR
eukprot:PhM_4_TR10424/c3_g1_i2/m.71657/K17914/KIF13; kinesin family member 13